jgi:phospholipase/lecithinase/hemolysin
LYVIWTGANDFAAGITPRTTVTNIRNALAKLAKAGAKDFIVIDAPDISLTPRVQTLRSETIRQARQFVAAVNLLLALEIPLAASLDRINITLVDINALFVPLVLNPICFGFSNSTTPALVTLAPNSNVNPDDYVFWDDFHTTTGAHLLAAKFIYHAASFKFSFSALSLR